MRPLKSLLFISSYFWPVLDQHNLNPDSAAALTGILSKSPHAATNVIFCHLNPQQYFKKSFWSQFPVFFFFKSPKGIILN